MNFEDLKSGDIVFFFDSTFWMTQKVVDVTIKDEFVYFKILDIDNHEYKVYGKTRVFKTQSCSIATSKDIVIKYYQKRIDILQGFINDLT